MGKYSPLFKHNILTQYIPHQRKNGFDSLAHRFNINSGGKTIKRWYDRWNGTVASLERSVGSGRTTIMKSNDMKKYITTPIRRKNKKNEAVHYSTLQSAIRSKYSNSISSRSIRRYGKERLGIRKKKTKKCTTLECKQITKFIVLK